MLKTLYAKKTGMTSRYTTEGDRVGATILEVPMTKVKDLITKDKRGYNAVRVEFMSGKKQKNREIRTDETPEIGSEIKVEEFVNAGDHVDISGIMKGKGFAGPVKRYGFKGGPRTHGQSDRERSPGSSGPTTTPGRVLKGKRRAGHMGNEKVMIKNLRVLEVNGEKRLITVQGGVPGARGGMLLVRRAA
jgi:large subunit ribosomal protein L3